jgi:hypothetical protein
MPYLQRASIQRCNNRYGNINGGYQKTKETMNGVPVFYNE